MVAAASVLESRLNWAEPRIWPCAEEGDTEAYRGNGWVIGLSWVPVWEGKQERQTHLPKQTDVW